MNGALDRPAVSIIMPCFNGAAHLPTSVGSVLKQTFEDWELIVVDDGSTDNSFEWLASQTDPRVVVVCQSNQGVSAARNSGLGMARAEYVAFLDADDTWAPTFLEKMVTALQSQPRVVLAYCGWQNVGLSGGRGQPFIPPDYETPDKREKLFAGCRWPIHATLTCRDAVMASSGFDTTLRNAEDYAMWLRIAGSARLLSFPLGRPGIERARARGDRFHRRPARLPVGVSGLCQHTRCGAHAGHGVRRTVAARQ
jgi:glycosyltransferase involved in cell wall biosynthesis